MNKVEIVSIVIMIVLAIGFCVGYIEQGFYDYLDDARSQAMYSTNTDSFSTQLHVMIIEMEKKGRTQGTCASAYEELRQIYFDSGKLTPTSTIQEFERLKIRLNRWELPPMFCK